ncbi:MAG: STAS domain-containing protein [Clostridiales bacterium]|jgi:anti-sigma B factor antagonist|nr:STAS domain-containing protein [Clostridiales bacterium]
MTITKSEYEGAVALAAEGKLDNNTSDALRAAIEDNFDGTGRLFLDFEKLAYVSSAGLRVILAVYRKADERGGGVVLRNVNAEILELFDMTGFSDIVVIENK